VKRIVQLQLLMVFGLSTVASGQTLQVVRVQTDDPAGYVAWAAESADALLGGNPGAVTTCLPRFGGEEGVDAYWVASAPDTGTILSLDLNGPVVQRETGRVADLRTVVARDIFLTVKTGRAIQPGDSWQQIAFFVDTDQPARYLELVAELERGFHANGLDDVFMEAHTMNSGDYAGKLHIAMQAPDGQRLGDALDASATAAWSNFARGDFNGVRRIVRALFIECTTHAVNP
jgi:hypothetical protein